MYTIDQLFKLKNMMYTNVHNISAHAQHMVKNVDRLGNV